MSPSNTWAAREPAGMIVGGTGIQLANWSDVPVTWQTASNSGSAPIRRT